MTIEVVKIQMHDLKSIESPPKKNGSLPFHMDFRISATGLAIKIIIIKVPVFRSLLLGFLPLGTDCSAPPYGHWVNRVIRFKRRYMDKLVVAGKGIGRNQTDDNRGRQDTNA